MLWKRFSGPSRAQSLLLALTRSFFLHGCGPVLVVSEEVGDQVVELTGGRKDGDDIFVFRPTYAPDAFAPADGEEGPASSDGGFRVLFVGRVERDKGVFLLLDVAERFAAEGRHDITFDICGTGTALPAARARVDAAGLGASVTLHGHCDRATVQARYAACDVVVVPTTTDFVEGFNKVVAEAVLAGKPVVTSEVCPALRTVEGAVVAVAPDHPGPYGDAILALRDDEALYRSKQQAGIALRDQFQDPERSWGHHFEAALTRLGLVPG